MSKLKILKTNFVLMLILSSFAGVNAQTMKVFTTNGSTTSYSIASDSKVYFADNNLIFDNASNSIAIDQIKKITFDATSGVFDVFKSTTSELIITPNPAKSYIQIKNLPAEKCSVGIFSVTGANVISTNATASSSSVDISALPQGVYIIRVNNLTAKFIKL